MIGRWTNTGMEPNVINVIADWAGLLTVARVEPGPHALKLVADSTNLIDETDETDNEFEAIFTWLAPMEDVSTPAPARLPDLVPHTPPGWDAPIVATSYAQDVVDGPLSVDAPTYLLAAARNRGLASTPEDVWVYLYVDDILVDMRLTDGLLIEDPVARSRFTRLMRVVRLSPGVHDLRLVVDPNDLVLESNEDNNTYEKQFEWGTGPVPPQPSPTPATAPARPAPLTLPNLVPGWPFGGDGPIVASRELGTLLDSVLTAGQTHFIDIAVGNQSIVSTGVPFAVDLYIDGETVHRFEFPQGATAKHFVTVKDWDALSDNVDLVPGAHTLRIVIDPENAVEESSEDDNVYEKTVVLAESEVEDPLPITYTEEDLGEMLSDLQEVLDANATVAGPEFEDRVEQLLRFADAGYYLATGRSLIDERVDIFILARDGYLEWIESSFAKKFAESDGSQYDALVARKEIIRRQSSGFKTRDEGRVAIVVDADHSVAEVLNSLAHEIGHMLQDLIEPDQSEAPPSFFLQAIHEAQAQQFQRVFWLKIEEFTGLSLLDYPDYPGFRSIIGNRVSDLLANANREEHSLGYLLQWLAVLDDPDLTDLAQQIADTGRLDGPASLELFHYLIALPPESVQAYVEARLSSVRRNIGFIRAIAASRLVPGPELEFEGPMELRVAGLMMP